MADLADGETTEVQGSGSNRYTLKNVGGAYSCSCPAWRNAGGGIERRTCKHLKKLRGEAVELARVGSPPPRENRAPGAEAKAVPPLLLAHAWENDQDLRGWWMSEKLDGVRAYWDGARFVSRLGNVYHAPAWFVAGLPATPLDGELWGGRRKFQRTVSIVRRQDRSDHWKEIQFVVFDAPAAPDPFEERLASCRRWQEKDAPPHAKVLEHELCRDVDHLRVELARVEALGGEGLMLRKPGSRYEVGRSSTLLKVKSFKDAEARVLEHLAGAGRHEGRLGALAVAMPDGTRFSIGTGFSDAERERPPPPGSLVTYRYQELSEAGVPRFPSYVGVRDDVAWTGPAAPVAAPPPPATPGPASGFRRFELVSETSNKFWEIAVEGARHTVRFGAIGARGQTKVKTFADESAAARDAEKLIAEKTKKGYVTGASQPIRGT
jgi:DNA ligase-1